MHVAWRHGTRIEAVITMEVDVPRSWLRRSRKGLWYCTRDIPAARFLPVGQGIGASVRPHRITSPRSSQDDDKKRADNYYPGW